MSDEDYATKENIAAIAIQWGWHRVKYMKALKVAATQGGSSEFFSLAIDAGEILEKVAKQGKIEWGENADWPITVDAYAESILDYAIKFARFPSEKELPRIATQSIEWT